MVSMIASYSPKTFSFEGSKLLLDFCLAGNRILYFCNDLESIHKFIIELLVLQSSFVRESNKKQRRGRIFSNFTKGRLFYLLWQPSALGGNLTMWPLFFYPPRKTFLSSSVWPRREYTWTLDWKQSSLIYFENCQDVPFSHE